MDRRTFVKSVAAFFGFSSIAKAAHDTVGTDDFLIQSHGTISIVRSNQATASGKCLRHYRHVRGKKVVGPIENLSSVQIPAGSTLLVIDNVVISAFC